ncbi:MAG: MFS transporter [Candidatus Caccosoma sp.]|nr:MFS transporter [Candidatus Caccosoma sp.]
MKKSLTIKNIILIIVLGFAGQLCWNMENQWFNTYVYAKIGPYPGIVTCMLIFSALATAFSTFLFGTLTDRIGKRKPFLCIGYIVWGITTFIFGVTDALKGFSPLWFVSTMVVVADCVMSFFGSMGNDCAYSAWTTDLLNEENKGFIGTSIAVMPIVGTIVGTLLGGIIISSFGYHMFFAIMGGIVSLIGIICIFTMKDVDNIKINKNGSFWKQFFSNFNFKEFIKNRELVLVFIILSIFFIGFNCFFAHIGNLFIYNYNFKESDFGIVEGAALIVSIIICLFFGKLLNKNIAPKLTLISIITEVCGLIFLTILSFNNLFNGSNVFSIDNLALFIGMVIVGVGYILFMQVVMIWAKELYPEDKRGQIEGVKIIFFVLIPMIFGSLISNVLINLLGKETIIDYGYGPVSGKAPNHYLFIAAAIVIILAIIPLYYVNKIYKERIKK